MEKEQKRCSQVVMDGAYAPCMHLRFAEVFAG